MIQDDFYDIVIVGAGVAGSILGKQLADRGKRVLMLEAGPGTGLEQGGFQSFVERFLTQELKTPTSPYPHSDNAPIQRPFHEYYEQSGPMNYGSNYMRHAGGTTLHWMGTCLRFLPEDFRLKSLYGHGIDWPITYTDLQPYYQMAEWELGVSANAAEQQSVDRDDQLYATGYDYPMERVPPSYLDDTIRERFEGKSIDIDGRAYPLEVSSTPAARNSIPRANLTDPREAREIVGSYRPVGDPDLPDERGGRCQGNASCIPICPVQAKYSALKTLRTAIERNCGRLDVIIKAVASLIEIDPGSERVVGVRYKKYADPDQPSFTEHVARGRVYVIAAHAIETAKLLLASDAANSSELVGCNLMDHPFVLTWGLMPKPIGSYRGPGSTSGIPLFRDGAFRSESAAFRVEIGNWGVDFPNGTPHTTLMSLVDRKHFNDAFGNHPEGIRQAEHAGDLFGKALRQEMQDVCSRQFRLGFELEQLPDPKNCVTIQSRYKDAIGNYRPVISYRLDDYCKKGIVNARKASDEIFAKLGVTDETDYDRPSGIAAGRFKVDGQWYEYHGAGHAVGTHRMGNSPRDSVVDADQRTWDHPNLFLVGGGNFCTIGTANPTLTIAALAFKAADAITKELA
ncbi:Fructose dehydrogenase large subunit [Symmachiella dynata]|uniref:Fructose dehydrogenase large subunit n=1 Tax=Symmachiella dynata TaxID=2527995 RepID=A0A517ZK80_9PLAN|nr:GMC family oxidoreductase [Symmachiella dynata]QDU42867.1 Fructose dehydrogenase large subunit [Symmachiella dynata]